MRPNPGQPGEAPLARFAKTKPGFRALITWLGAGRSARVINETTGPQHSAFDRHFSGKLALCLPALVAARFNPDPKRMYRAIHVAGELFTGPGMINADRRLSG